MSLRNRIYLAKFAFGIDEIFNDLSRRTINGEKRMATIYREILQQAYPEIERPKGDDTSGLYQNKYNELKVRYQNGKRWYAMVEKLSWLIMLLIPTDGKLGIHNYQVHNMAGAMYELILSILVREKGRFLDRVTQELAKVIEVREDGVISLKEDKILLEKSTIEVVEVCIETSEALAQMAGVRP